MGVIFTKKLKRDRKWFFIVDKYNKGKAPIKRRI